jgi:hypothetical protein
VKFRSDKVAFGRHETFALRYSWLPKGFQAQSGSDADIFAADEATITLGVGKNMVSAIRYWLRACQLISNDSPPQCTELGSLLLNKDGLDPYLEDEATIWLLHWLLASNPELATSWYWFFNRYHKPEFTSQELVTALSDFVRDQVDERHRPSLSTLKNDAQLLHRMYTQSKGNGRTPLEEALDSPLALLRLVTQTAGGRSFQSRPEYRPNLPVQILGFAVTQLLQSRGTQVIPIEDLMYPRDGYPAPGAVFRLTENDLIAKLERLVYAYQADFDIRESSGIHQFFQKSDIDPIKLLEDHYHEARQGVAA